MEGQAQPVLNAQEPILNAQAPPVLNAQESILNVQAPPLASAAAAIPPPAIPSIIPYIPQPHGSPSAQFVRRMGFRMAAYSQLDLEGKFRDVSQRCIHLADSRQFAAVHVFAKEGSRLQNVKEAGYIAGLERVAKQVWGGLRFCGDCVLKLTHLSRSPSTTPMAGRGVFSRREFPGWLY